MAPVASSVPIRLSIRVRVDMVAISIMIGIRVHVLLRPKSPNRAVAAMDDTKILSQLSV